MSSLIFDCEKLLWALLMCMPTAKNFEVSVFSKDRILKTTSSK